MPRSMLLTVLSLLVAVGAQLLERPPFSCVTDGPQVTCHSGNRRVEFLQETATWRQAHELCRRQRAFLVPSLSVLNTIRSDPQLIERASDRAGFWLGARYLRNGYFEWLLQFYDSYFSSYERIRVDPTVDPANLCGRMTTVRNELELGWLPCNDSQGVVCFSDAETEAETRPAGYRPSLTAAVTDGTLIQPGPFADEVHVTNNFLPGSNFHINITCGPGDNVVKDHFVLGKSRYMSSWWSGNFTIMRHLFPPVGRDLLGVGTYWCQRYVEGVADPVVSGRLHVTSSKDLYVLTAPTDSIVNTLQLLLSDDAEFDDGSGSGFPFDGNADRPAFGELDVGTGLERLLRRHAFRIDFASLYDFPTRDTPLEETFFGTEYTGGTTKIVSLIISFTTALDKEALRETNITRVGGERQSQPLLKNVIRCPNESVGGYAWTQAASGVGYTASEPACVATGLPALVERRCTPSFESAGAQWGPFCAAGMCQERLPSCRSPPPLCPLGFTITELVSGDEQPYNLCMFLLTGVTFEERGLKCRRRDPSATPWFPQRTTADLSVLQSILADETFWLPFRRLWLHGALPPQVLRLLNTGTASLNSSLNCTVMTSRGALVSSSCTARHAVLCATRPLYQHRMSSTVQQPEGRGRHCESLLELGGTLTEGSESCFAFLCPDTASPITAPVASSLCTEANSSLASLTSQRQLDAIIRLGRARGRPAQTAVSLERRGDRAVWGDGTPLSYPALAPDLSTAEQHTRGILDLDRGQYDFVSNDGGAVNCALCERRIQVGPPEIVIFYGNAHPGAPVIANVTTVQHLVTEWEDDLLCFLSTAERADRPRRISQSDGDVRGGFLVRRLQALPTHEGKVFIEIFPSVDFGFLTCALLIPGSGEQITSNSLQLIKRPDGQSVQEYVIGLRDGLWHRTLCDLTLCVNACCFNRTLGANFIEYQRRSFLREMYPLRATRNDSEVVSHYYVTLDFAPPMRRRRQTEYPEREEGTKPKETTSQADDSRPRFQEQNPAGLDGRRILRDNFGAQLVYVNHARCCPAERTEEPVPLSWPRTCGSISISTELCRDSSGQPALRRCLGGPLTGVYWGPVEFRGTSCTAVSAASANLHRLSQNTVTAANSASIAAELQQLTAEPAALTSPDLVSAAVTLENIQARLEGRDTPTEEIPTLQRSAVTTVSQLMEADSAAIEDATELFAAGPRVVNSLERILIDSLAESIPNVTTENVAVRSGDFVGISSSASEIVGSSLQTVARGTKRFALFGVESALFLKEKKLDVPVVFLVYRDGRLLPSRGQSVTSQVVSALLPPEGDETQFRNNVLVTFRSRPGQCAPAPVCAFWDAAISQWSTRGCWLEGVHNGSDVCRCNHLTNFARIFNYETDVYLSETYQRTLDIITYIGSALSLIGLSLTMLTFVLFRKWRRLRSSQIVMNMSVTLTGVYAAFLAGLAAKENHVACVCLSALLHFFLIATFGWMAVEAVFQYLRFVRVIGRGAHISRFMLKASLLVWGGSLVPVICVLATRPHCYDGQPEVCWMDFQSFYYALALPVAALMVFNAALFGLIVYSLNCGRQKGLRTNQSERQLAMRRLRVSFVTFVLLGLPWVFGFLSIKETRLVFSVVFCICSMLQGFAIFLLMIAGERGVRELWRSLLVGRCCAADTDASASSEPVRSATGETSETLASSRSQQDTKL